MGCPSPTQPQQAATRTSQNVFLVGGCPTCGRCTCLPRPGAKHTHLFTSRNTNQGECGSPSAKPRGPDGNPTQPTPPQPTGLPGRGGRAELGGLGQVGWGVVGRPPPATPYPPMVGTLRWRAWGPRHQPGAIPKDATTPGSGGWGAGGKGPETIAIRGTSGPQPPTPPHPSPPITGRGVGRRLLRI